MPSYRKNRGVDSSLGNDNDIDDKKAKWGMITANRVLTCLFPETPLPDGNSIQMNDLTKYIDYNADTLAQRAKEYFQNIYQMAEQGTPIVPDIEDFCLWCKIPRSRFSQYRASHSIPLNCVANNISNAIAMCKKQMAFDGSIPPVVFAIDFNNNHDYIQQRVAVESHTTYEIEAQDSINDIASRLPSLEPPKGIEQQE